MGSSRNATLQIPTGEFHGDHKSPKLRNQLGVVRIWSIEVTPVIDHRIECGRPLMIQKLHRSVIDLCRQQSLPLQLAVPNNYRRVYLRFTT